MTVTFPQSNARLAERILPCLSQIYVNEFALIPCFVAAEALRGERSMAAPLVGVITRSKPDGETLTRAAGTLDNLTVPGKVREISSPHSFDLLFERTSSAQDRRPIMQMHGTYLHLCGKRLNPNRKVRHIRIVSESAEERPDRINALCRLLDPRPFSYQTDPEGIATGIPG